MADKNVTVITYGTFDLFHPGHVRLLRRARELGTRLVVGCSSDKFNLLKDKKSINSYEQRREILLACRYVDDVFPEDSWEQKREDILRTKADIFVMGDDWTHKFDFLSDIVKVVYLKRTSGISSTDLRNCIYNFSKNIPSDKMENCLNNGSIAI
ncbi:adenylyltransferase/cytidyltransferase family protein [Acetobacter oeni]|uniref:Glycerol-3-phosphate cytidylyltransferase n=1 Tax=Acetobacter oeni TaxID=304077 RepID=A0A511XM56_9PROT|nr:adenylyltransferase/cytidyltransferase family protein [Acetobacter oeni]MBB3884038.1 glycerol-3-phosphate cytidylyltransferase [Acetobacter oeni]NHO20015.1 adenylyltransferase/cytidyltransferase family protein [Acetobacter oeni]GBR04552.1 glycerol-3-phosphate cytidyltransferase [Acetobacter oeni LMG 21952]GEN64025.1 glycerol-3-phosphate cytidylyltransferase [Acetobacter oeni]